MKSFSSVLHVEASQSSGCFRPCRRWWYVSQQVLIPARSRRWYHLWPQATLKANTSFSSHHQCYPHGCQSLPIVPWIDIRRLYHEYHRTSPYYLQGWSSSCWNCFQQTNCQPVPDRLQLGSHSIGTCYLNSGVLAAYSPLDLIKCHLYFTVLPHPSFVPESQGRIEVVLTPCRCHSLLYRTVALRRLPGFKLCIFRTFSLPNSLWANSYLGFLAVRLEVPLTR